MFISTRHPQIHVLAESPSIQASIRAASMAGMERAREVLVEKIQKAQAKREAMANAALMDRIKDLGRDEMKRQRRAFTQWEAVGDDLRREFFPDDDAAPVAASQPEEQQLDPEELTLDTWTVQKWRKHGEACDISTLVDESVEWVSVDGKQYALSGRRGPAGETEVLGQTSWSDVLDGPTWNELARVVTWENRPRPTSSGAR